MLNKLVTPLFYAKQFKEHGINQTSCFYWTNTYKDQWILTNYNEKQKFDLMNCESISAFISEELIKFIPLCINFKNKCLELSIGVYEAENLIFITSYINEEGSVVIEKDESEVVSRCRLINFLIKSQLI